MLVHILLDPWVRVPLFAVAFVAADMEVGVWKEGRHFAYKAIEKFVCALARGVHRWVEDAPFPLDEIWAFATREVGVSDKPSSGVAGHVELRNHTDATVASEVNRVTDLILRVVVSVRSLLLQEREELAFDAESL